MQEYIRYEVYRCPTSPEKSLEKLLLYVVNVKMKTGNGLHGMVEL